MLTSHGIAGNSTINWLEEWLTDFSVGEGKQWTEKFQMGNQL